MSKYFPEASASTQSLSSELTVEPYTPQEKNTLIHPSVASSQRTVNVSSETTEDTTIVVQNTTLPQGTQADNEKDLQPLDGVGFLLDDEDDDDFDCDDDDRYPSDEDLIQEDVERYFAERDAELVDEVSEDEILAQINKDSWIRGKDAERRAKFKPFTRNNPALFADETNKELVKILTRPYSEEDIYQDFTVSLEAIDPTHHGFLIQANHPDTKNPSNTIPNTFRATNKTRNPDKWTIQGLSSKSGQLYGPAYSAREFIKTKGVGGGLFYICELNPKGRKASDRDDFFPNTLTFEFDHGTLSEQWDTIVTLQKFFGPEARFRIRYSGGKSLHCTVVFSDRFDSWSHYDGILRLLICVVIGCDSKMASKQRISRLECGMRVAKDGETLIYQAPIQGSSGHTTVEEGTEALLNAFRAQFSRDYDEVNDFKNYESFSTHHSRKARTRDLKGYGPANFFFIPAEELSVILGTKINCKPKALKAKGFDRSHVKEVTAKIIKAEETREVAESLAQKYNLVGVHLDYDQVLTIVEEAFTAWSPVLRKSGKSSHYVPGTGTRELWFNIFAALLFATPTENQTKDSIKESAYEFMAEWGGSAMTREGQMSGASFCKSISVLVQSLESLTKGAWKPSADAKAIIDTAYANASKYRLAAPMSQTAALLDRRLGFPLFTNDAEWFVSNEHKSFEIETIDEHGPSTLTYKPVFVANFDDLSKSFQDGDEKTIEALANCSFYVDTNSIELNSADPVKALEALAISLSVLSNAAEDQKWLDKNGSFIEGQQGFKDAVGYPIGTYFMSLTTRTISQNPDCLTVESLATTDPKAYAKLSPADKRTANYLAECTIDGELLIPFILGQLGENKGRIFSLSAGTGNGKTYTTGKVAEKLGTESTYIAPLSKLAGENGEKFNPDFSDGETVHKLDGVACCVQSLSHKFKAECITAESLSVLVIDEANAVIGSLLSDTHGGQAEKNIEILTKMIKVCLENGGVIFLIQQNLSEAVVKFVEALVDAESIRIHSDNVNQFDELIITAESGEGNILAAVTGCPDDFGPFVDEPTEGACVRSVLDVEPGGIDIATASVAFTRKFAEVTLPYGEIKYVLNSKPIAKAFPDYVCPEKVWDRDLNDPIIEPTVKYLKELQSTAEYWSTGDLSDPETAAVESFESDPAYIVDELEISKKELATWEKAHAAEVQANPGIVDDLKRYSVRFKLAPQIRREACYAGAAEFKLSEWLKTDAGDDYRDHVDGQPVFTINSAVVTGLAAASGCSTVDALDILKVFIASYDEDCRLATIISSDNRDQLDGRTLQNMYQDASNLGLHVIRTPLVGYGMDFKDARDLGFSSTMVSVTRGSIEDTQQMLSRCRDRLPTIVFVAPKLMQGLRADASQVWQRNFNRNQKFNKIERNQLKNVESTSSSFAELIDGLVADAGAELRVNSVRIDNEKIGFMKTLWLSRNRDSLGLDCTEEQFSTAWNDLWDLRAACLATGNYDELSCCYPTNVESLQFLLGDDEFRMAAFQLMGMIGERAKSQGLMVSHRLKEADEVLTGLHFATTDNYLDQIGNPDLSIAAQCSVMASAADSQLKFQEDGDYYIKLLAEAYEGYSVIPIKVITSKDLQYIDRMGNKKNGGRNTPAVTKKLKAAKLISDSRRNVQYCDARDIAKAIQSRHEASVTSTNPSATDEERRAAQLAILHFDYPGCKWQSPVFIFKCLVEQRGSFKIASDRLAHLITPDSLKLSANNAKYMQRAKQGSLHTGKLKSKMTADKVMSSLGILGLIEDYAKTGITKADLEDIEFLERAQKHADEIKAMGIRTDFKDAVKLFRAFVERLGYELKAYKRLSAKEDPKRARVYCIETTADEHQVRAEILTGTYSRTVQDAERAARNSIDATEVPVDELAEFKRNVDSHIELSARLLEYTLERAEDKELSSAETFG